MGKIPSEGCLIHNSSQIFYAFICQITNNYSVYLISLWLGKKNGNLTDKNINGNNLSVCLTLRKCLSKLYAYLTII